MDLHEIVQFKKEINGRLYQFSMPKMAPVGEVYDAFFEGLKKVMEIAQKNVEKMVRPQEEQEESKQD